MPQVPGTPSYGQGGWGTHPGHLPDYRWMYSWGVLVGGAVLSVTAVGKLGKVGLGLRSHAYRLLRPAEILGGVAHKGGQLYMKQRRWQDIAVIYGLFKSSSPGGGGPGHSPTSTATPPSIEEVGRIITSGGRSRKRCPSGYRWNGRRCVRKD